MAGLKRTPVHSEAQATLIKVLAQAGRCHFNKGAEAAKRWGSGIRGGEDEGRISLHIDRGGGGRNNFSPYR